MMLGPDSRLLTALLIAASAALLVAVVRLRLLPGQDPLRRLVDHRGDDRRRRGGQLLPVLRDRDSYIAQKRVGLVAENHRRP